MTMPQQPETFSKPLASFSDKSDRFNRALRFWVALILLLILASFVYWLILQFIPRVEKFGTGIIWINAKVILVLLLIVLVLLLWLILGNLPRKRWLVTIYPEGIQLVHGKRERYIAWESLESLSMAYSSSRFLGIGGPARRKLTLQTVGGENFTLDGKRLDQFETLVRQIREGAFPILYTQASTTLERAGRVSFGAVTLLQEGWLQMDSKTIPLEEISSVKFDKGWLKVTRRNKQYKQRADQITNLDVLVKLLSEKTNLDNTTSAPA
jgi:hypothetical protein